MGINKFNNEHYYDPTSYEALSNIEKEEKQKAFMPLVYICSPFSGEVENNIKRACEFCRFATKSNCIPLAPHLLFPQFLDDDNPAERELAMFMNMVLLGKCNQLWVFGDKISKGMATEITKAKYRHQTVRYFSENLKEVLK